MKANKKFMFIFIISLVAFVLGACGDVETSDEGEQSNNLTVYAAVNEEEAAEILAEFERQTGINVNFVRLSAGQVFTRVQSESDNPQASVWFGGPTDTFLEAAEHDLLESYISDHFDELNEQFIDDEEGYVSPIYVGALGFATNENWLEANDLDPPTSWDDLLKPEFQNNISMPHPAASGTAYTILATITQKLGEDEGFEYMAALDNNIQRYSSSGSAPLTNAGLGEVGVGIGFAHGIANVIDEGYPITLTFPVDGTGYEIGGVAMIKGGPEDEVENAKTFIDWFTSKEGQSVYAELGYNRLPVHPEAEVPEGGVPIDEIEVIDYDAMWAGQQRDTLLNRFRSEIVEETEVD